MSDCFDERLEDALWQNWAVPEHGPGFDEKLWARIDAADVADAAPRPAEPVSRRPGRRRWLLLAAAGLALAAGIAAAVIAGAPREKQAQTSKPAASVAVRRYQAAGAASALWAPMLEPVRDPSVKGISLDEALARIGKPLPLPPEARTQVAKIVLFGNAGSFDLGILFTSGIELLVTPDPAGDFKAVAVPYERSLFSDGRMHFKLQTVAGKEVLTTAGGMQAGLADGWRISTSAHWDQDGYSYTLYDPSEDVSPAATEKAIGNLLALVAETK